MTMRIAFRSLWLTLALLVVGPGAAAKGEAARPAAERFDCRLMEGLQCSAESRAELLAYYGLPTAESRLAAGSEMYRVFIFDAWLRHHVAITVERGPGAPPTLTLHAPPRPGRQGAGAQAVPPLSTPISLDDWYAVRRRARFFERALVPEPLEVGELRLCGHGPLYFVESADPGADDDRRLRRSGLSGCHDGLAEQFSVEVALMAGEVLPTCAELDWEGFHFPAERLRACSILSGDGPAAAEVHNLMRPLLAEEQERPSAKQLAALFEGVETTGPAAKGAGAEQAWLQALAGGWRTDFVVERVHARSADHVAADGLLRRRHLLEADDPPERVEEAAVQLVWTRDRMSDFEIKAMTIGAYEPAPDHCRSSARTRRAVDC